MMKLNRPLNMAAISQHLEEAAFYWRQHQLGLWSPVFEKHDIERIENVVKANLRGLRAAGEPVVAPALELLDRWHAPGELFVAAFLAAITKSDQALGQIDAELQTNPKLAFAAESALFSAQNHESLSLAETWFSNANSALRAASIKPLISLTPDPKDFVQSVLTDSDPIVAAKALQGIGQKRYAGFEREIEKFLEHSNPECRIEASITRALLGGDPTPRILFESIGELLDSGSPRPLSHREVELPVVRQAVLCAALTADDASFEKWLDDSLEAEQRRREALWSIAFRGNPLLLERLQPLADVPELNQLVGYIVWHITGVDFEGAGLLAANLENDDGFDYDQESVEDDGLDMIDPGKLNAWLDRTITNYEFGQPILGGHVVNDATLARILDEGTQPQRWNVWAHFALGRF
jgi:uncharacterized protein (TIGR02270 family)